MSAIVNDGKKMFRNGSAVNIVRLAQDPLELHRHEFDELVIVAKGKGIHFTDKEEYPVIVGDVFFIKPGECHGYRNTENLEIINVLYFPAKIKLPLDSLKGSAGYRVLFELEPEMRRREGLKSKLNLTFDELLNAENIIGKIQEEARHGDPCGYFLSAAYLMQLIGTLSRLYEKIPDTRSFPLIRLGDTLSYLETGYRKNITLDALVRRSNMSKSTLIRAFRKITGTTPLDYLLKMRIAKASELLKNADVSVSDAAMLTGFSDSNYFSRQFRKHTGISPSEIRKIYRKIS